MRWRLAVWWCLLAVAPGAAAEVPIIGADEIVHGLQSPRTRGLVKLVDGTSPSDSVPAAESVARMTFPSIQFAFDSAELLPSARAQLDEVGKALKDSRLDGLGFEVRGHTDATGAPAHNQALSQARAATVRTYLVERFGVTPARLQPRGIGASELLPGLPARDPGQRRVELIGLE